MVSCSICGKTFQDRRGLHGHFRFKHGIEYGSGEPAKKTVLTEATKKKIEEMNKGQELTEVIKDKEFQTHSLDNQINEAREEIKRLNEAKELTEVIKDKEFQTRSLDKQINEAKNEIKQLNEEIKRLNKSVQDKNDSVTPVVPSTSQKAGEESTQPVLKRENIDKPTARSNRREEKGTLREIYNETIGEAVRDIRDLRPRPGRFFRIRKRK